MKSKIIKILKESNTIISGVEISSHLGISRVSVWKHIKKLQELGYNIISTPRGYQLNNKSPDKFNDKSDLLYPWEFPERESEIHYFQELDSTMNKAREFAKKGYPEYTVIIAERQNQGRGRLKRHWYSDTGGLYFTIILKPEISPRSAYKYNFVTSLVLARTLNEMFHIDAMVKWPNDILVGMKKLSGMLSEMEAEANLVSFINIGIGLNVNNDPTETEPNAVSLKALLCKKVSRKKILSRFLDNLEIKLNNMKESDDIISQWKECSITLNRQVTIVTPKDISEGIARDIDQDGALILELENGLTKKIIYGDCFLK